MSEEYRKGQHAVYDIQYHFVWVTKYRYHVLKGDVASRARELIRQTCEARNITILNGHVSRDHIHLHVSCPLELAPSKIVQYIKGRSSPVNPARISTYPQTVLGKSFLGSWLFLCDSW